MSDRIVADLLFGGNVVLSQDVSDALQVAGGISASMANPTGTVGLSAVNGTSTDALRSDSAPALSQSIAPTWTGAHTFSGNDVTLTNGNLKVNTIGKTIQVKEGTNAKMGIVTLSGGTATVNTTAVAANSRIMLQHQTRSGISLFSGVGVSARTAGTSFTISSGNILDTSDVAWWIIDPL